MPSRRLKGKIASLSKDQRDYINKLLLDGATYAVVIGRMAAHGISLLRTSAGFQRVAAPQAMRLQPGRQECLPYAFAVRGEVESFVWGTGRASYLDY